MRLNEINIRDPFVLPYKGKYYLYGTRVGKPSQDKAWGEQSGFDVYVSEDLKEWIGPKSVFKKNNNFWGERDFWAPEVHYYNDKFYMLATFKADDKCRGTHILVSDSPDGKFVPVSKERITPCDWECLDGTLYIDRKGKPHIVFCHEWLQIGDGEVCEMELSADLSKSVYEPRTLWHASDYKGSKNVLNDKLSLVTDGPFMFRCKNGELVCIWSTMTENGYAELISCSDNGDIDGNWTVFEKPLFAQDGGHGMIFNDFEDNCYFIMHHPNAETLERPVLSNVNTEKKQLAIIE